MIRRLFAAGMSLTLCAGASAAPTGESPERAGAPAVQADAMKLCERLAGTEREICVSQARENQRIADHALGATPGHGGVGSGQQPMPRSRSGESSNTDAARDTR